MRALADWAADNVRVVGLINVLAMWPILSLLRPWPTVSDLVAVLWGIGTIFLLFFLLWRGWMTKFEEECESDRNG